MVDKIIVDKIIVDKIVSWLTKLFSVFLNLFNDSRRGIMLITQ